MNAQGEKVTVTLVRPDGSVYLQEEVDAEKWAKFEKRAQELGVPVEELFDVAMDAFLESKGC